MERLTCRPGVLLRPQGLLSFSVLNAYFADFLAYLFGDFNDLFFLLLLSDGSTPSGIGSCRVF
jgi:hypothetical protein